MEVISSSERLKIELEKPFEAEPRNDGFIHGDDEFNPWSLFPSIYGSYSREFDVCAIEVLQELENGVFERDDLGAQMFREMLCVAGFCDYGSSPRVCYWDIDMEMLRKLIVMWKNFSRNNWGEL